ncbi:helix-turn-helix domain-containing protein [Gaiella sp.]|uniref:helix-turn-helix domain-containing protein n=1 Tax=Gaiella sp. TaxID=2663207 RepID=UPI002E372B08|nr:helix-turn-helix domain-containing protein [Gaiella sp.]HEX5584005.1 helix-turn-helix domain-containing protein [Gaiella sp.]
MSAWLSIKEAAARSGFSTKTLYRAIAAGELRAKKVRSRWRIAVHDLEAWLLPRPTVPRPAVVRVAAPPETGSQAALRRIEGKRR